MLCSAWENSHGNLPFGTRQVPPTGTDRPPIGDSSPPTGTRRHLTDCRKSPRRKPPSVSKKAHLVEQATLYIEVPSFLTLLRDFPAFPLRQGSLSAPTAAPGRSPELLDAQLRRRRSLQGKRLEIRKCQPKKALSLTFSESRRSLAYLFAVWRFPTASHRPARCDDGVRRSDPTASNSKRWKSPPFVRVSAQKPLQKKEQVKLYLLS